MVDPVNAALQQSMSLAPPLLLCRFDPGRGASPGRHLLRPTSLANPTRITASFSDSRYLGRQMSNQGPYPDRMNRDLRRYMPATQEGETIATFGEARLVRDLGGRIEIVGGTEVDRREAREWASRFLRRLDPSGSIR
jgi:hypothetical protein